MMLRMHILSDSATTEEPDKLPLTTERSGSPPLAGVIPGGTAFAANGDAFVLLFDDDDDDDNGSCCDLEVAESTTGEDVWPSGDDDMDGKT